MLNSETGTTGLIDAISIGVAGMVCGGLFAILGEAVSFAHGATAIAFRVAALVALLTAYAYGKLAARYTSRNQLGLICMPWFSVCE